jgi:hypothetical protein
MRLDADACPNCGRLLPLYHDTRQVFCCHECCLTSYWQMVSESKRLARVGKICRNCGKEFDAKFKKFQIFCTHKCAKDSLRSPRPRRVR